MHILWILTLFLFIPFLFFLGTTALSHTHLMRPFNTRPATSIDDIVAYLAASSCMGDGFRARFAGVTVDPRRAVFDGGYLRNLGSGGQGSWEQMEMEDMIHGSMEIEDDDEDGRRV